MKSNLSLVALLTLVVATPSFGMNLNDLVIKTKASAQSARQALATMARTGSAGLSETLSNNPALLASAGLGAFAAGAALRTWRTTPGTAAQKAKSVLKSPVVTVPAGVSLATLAASYVPKNAVTALVQRFPAQTVASWSETVTQLLKDNPYYAATAAAAAAIAAYKACKLWNATAPVKPAKTTSTALAFDDQQGAKKEIAEEAQKKALAIQQRHANNRGETPGDTSSTASTATPPATTTSTAQAAGGAPEAIPQATYVSAKKQSPARAQELASAAADAVAARNNAKSQG